MLLISGHDNGCIVIWDLVTGSMLRDVQIENSKAVLSLTFLYKHL